MSQTIQLTGISLFIVVIIIIIMSHLRDRREELREVAHLRLKRHAAPVVLQPALRPERHRPQLGMRQVRGHVV